MKLKVLLGYDGFKEMSLDSKYIRWKNLINFFLTLKALKQKKKAETQLKKERIMKNVDQLYKNYYNAHKSDFDTDDELAENKKEV